MGESKIRYGRIKNKTHYQILISKINGSVKEIPTGFGIPEWAREIEGYIEYREIWSGGNPDKFQREYMFEMDMFPPKFSRIK